ncbi:MAG: serine/threonine protein kinase [Marmoricola sp.]|nr:serine/threonine protein kinase [Marmoricola sp.]
MTKRRAQIGVLAPLLVALAAIFGLPQTAQAVSVSVPCSDNGHTIHGQKEYNCGWFETTPVYNGSGTKVGTIHTGTNWVLCQHVGKTVKVDSYSNNHWAYTESDQGKWGWVVASYARGGTNNPSYRNVPACSQARHYNGSSAPGYPPQSYAKSGYQFACWVNSSLQEIDLHGVCQKYIRSDGVVRYQGYFEKTKWYWCGHLYTRSGGGYQCDLY